MCYPCTQCGRCGKYDPQEPLLHAAGHHSLPRVRGRGGPGHGGMPRLRAGGVRTVGTGRAGGEAPRHARGGAGAR